MSLQPLVRKFWSNQAFRYLIVGGINSLFLNGLYALFLFLRLHYTVAVLLALLIGVLFNFNTIGKLVFNNSKSGLIFRFAGIYAVLYIVNVLLLSVFDKFNLNMYFAGIILILPMAFTSFILNRVFVFS